MTETERSRMFDGKTLVEVADIMAGAGQGSRQHVMAKAEFLLRQTEIHKQLAEHTKTYTRYMLYSVVVMILAVLVKLFVAP